MKRRRLEESLVHLTERAEAIAREGRDPAAGGAAAPVRRGGGL